jgi:hypothetical protein
MADNDPYDPYEDYDDEAPLTELELAIEAICDEHMAAIHRGFDQAWRDLIARGSSPKDVWRAKLKAHFDAHYAQLAVNTGAWANLFKER